MRKGFISLFLILVVLSFAPVAQAEDKTKNLERQLMLEMFRHPVKPANNTRLKGLYPRLSLVAGQVEKFLYTFSEQEGSTLGFLLTHSAKPSVTANNPYVNNSKGGKTSSYEALIYKKIKESKGQLLPHQVLGIALEVTGGDYPEATLACHNFLKEITYAYRAKEGAVIGWDKADPEKVRSWNVIGDRDVIAVMDKLKNLRSSGDKYAKDTGGPWYHMFGLYFIGGLTSDCEARLFADAENLYRRIGWGTSATDDSFKMGINTRADNLSYWLNYLTKNAIYIPEDLSSRTDQELEDNLTELKALHRKLLDQLKNLSQLVNNDKLGPMIEKHTKLIKEIMNVVAEESRRIKEELSKREEKEKKASKPEAGKKLSDSALSAIVHATANQLGWNKIEDYELHYLDPKGYGGRFNAHTIQLGGSLGRVGVSYSTYSTPSSETPKKFAEQCCKAQKRDDYITKIIKVGTEGGPKYDACYYYRNGSSKINNTSIHLMIDKYRLFFDSDDLRRLGNDPMTAINALLANFLIYY